MTKQWGVLALTLGLALAAAGTARADDQTNKTDDTTIHDQTTVPSDQKTDTDKDKDDVQKQSGVDTTTQSSQQQIDLKSLKIDQAKQLQQKLSEKGFYQGKIDGHVGPLTLAAFHQFQKDQGMQVTDKIDFQTASALGVTLNESDMKPVRGVDENENPSATGTPSSGTMENQSGTENPSATGTPSSSGTMENQSGTESPDTGTMQNQSGTSGSTDIQNQSGTERNKCKDLTSPDAVNCNDKGTTTQSGTSSSSTDIQTQSGTSGSSTDVQNQSGSVGAGAAATGTPSQYGGVSTGSGTTGVEKQAGRDVTAVYDPATIKDAKQALKDKHFYKGKIDTKNDAKFQAALRDFQKKNHLAITGSLDPQTLVALGVQPSNTGTMENQGGTMDNGTMTNPTSTPAPAATGTPSSNPY